MKEETPQQLLATAPRSTVDYRVLDPGECKKHTTPDTMCFHCHILTMNKRFVEIEARMTAMEDLFLPKESDPQPEKTEKKRWGL